jgi:hypothetical protein
VSFMKCENRWGCRRMKFIMYWFVVGAFDCDARHPSREYLFIFIIQKPNIGSKEHDIS